MGLHLNVMIPEFGIFVVFFFVVRGYRQTLSGSLSRRLLDNPVKGHLVPIKKSSSIVNRISPDVHEKSGQHPLWG
jgi:hypothetical protein